MKYIKDDYQVRVQPDVKANLTVGSLHYFYSRESIEKVLGKDFIVQMKHFKQVPANVDKWAYKYKLEDICHKHGLNVWWDCEYQDSFWSSFTIKKDSKLIAKMSF